MTEPPVSSPEFVEYFEMVVKTSKTRGEAIRRLGYRNLSTLDRHLRKLGIKQRGWSVPNPGLLQQQTVPLVVIANIDDRPWVGGLIQAEGCIESHYVSDTDSTTLDVAVGMTDPAPIFKLSECYGMSRPTKPKKSSRGQKLIWRKQITGLRAMRVLREILPFLAGGKLREAERALGFFGPNGLRRGQFVPRDIWPPDEFPLRRSHIAKPSGPAVQSVQSIDSSTTIREDGKNA